MLGEAPGDCGEEGGIVRAEGKLNEGRAERDGRGSKWALGVAGLMWACGFFVARVPDATRPEFSGASALFVVAFALPSYAVLWRWAGPRTAVQVLVALGLFALGIESLAVATGWPYGEFSYGEAIGGKVLGLVPWTVPFAWTPLVLGTHALAERATKAWLPGHALVGREALRVQVLGVAVATLALAVADLVLDPGAVRQKFWAYPSGGLYYGVPASNYFGWLLSGVAGHALLRFLLRPAISKAAPTEAPGDPDAPNPSLQPRVPHRLSSHAPARPDASGLAGMPPAGLAVSLVWTLAFWASVCAWAGLWAPTLIGHAALAVMWLALRSPRSC